MPTASAPLPVHGVLPEVATASDACQRWSHGLHAWTHRSEGGFDSARYWVAPLDERDARDFVTAHHYSKAYPAASRRYGLHLEDSGELLGVAVFGIPAQARVLTNVFPTLTPYVQSLELSRFVLTSDMYARGPERGQPKAPGNSESWFLARCLAELDAVGVIGVVSFADPVPRRRTDGSVLMPGHVGRIYQASNAVYLDRATARTVTVLPDGTVVSDRALQKVRAGEQGHEYVERRLVALGARPPVAGQHGGPWLREALESVRARRLRHAGNHRYAMVTARRHRRTVALPASRAYPKSVDS